MQILLIIPARYASTRYPGKPLATLRGASGRDRSLIARSIDAARDVRGIDRVVVATDDPRIQAAAQVEGAQVAMTSSDCQNGTERCAEAAAQLGVGPDDIVVNLQGDAPLTPAWFVESLVEALKADPDAAIATPVLRCDGAALAAFRQDRRAGRVGGTTAVFDAHHRALYFSKEVIPYTGEVDPTDASAPTEVFHHVGVYSYRPAALAQYPSWPQGPLERLEGLEQLRFMEQGHKVLCVEVAANGRQFWELNNPEDIPRIESMMAQMGMD
jgi:3-deoxy-manno-octulosonate cytidylyltransferase (CMP-KDO synthetase)